MSEYPRDFFADLEHQIVDATTVDNRRRRRRVQRVGVPAVVAVGVAALVLATLPSGGATNGALVSVARAAETTMPTWARLELWQYSLDTSVDHTGAHSSGDYVLSTARRAGTRVMTSDQAVNGQAVATTDADLAHTFQAIADGQTASRNLPSSNQNQDQAYPELPVAVNALPQTSAGFQKLIDAESYGSSCGEKAMHLAADVLRVPGVAPAARRAMIDALAGCPDLHIDRAALDPLGRSGIGISVQGHGSGIETTTELIVDQGLVEPLSLIERTDTSQTKLALPAGTVLSADVFRYDG